MQHLAGAVARDRLGAVAPLAPGDAVAERDILKVTDGARLTLDDGGLGQFELGADSELGIEKLPAAPGAADPNTILDLRRGFLRIVWNPPAAGGKPTLYVYFGHQHAALGAGEFFFDSRNAAARACVAAGQMQVVTATAVAAQALGAPACYRFIDGLPPEQSPRDADSWPEIRANLSMDAPSSPEALLAQNDAEAAAAAAQPPAPAPRPAAPAPARAPAAPAKPAVRAEHGALPPAAAGTVAPETWVVSVGAFADAGQARKLEGQLRAGGFPAALEPVQVRGQTLWRVQLRGYRSADAGKAAAVALGKRFPLKNLWVTQLRPPPAGSASPPLVPAPPAGH
ncbi:MAG: SPOR domain-containing protein [Nevskia sp.]|nr:SPOR domain-containing protein [Nevskia sp.]